MQALRVAAVALLCACVCACTSMAPAYPASASNASLAAKLPGSVNVGAFAFPPGKQAELNSVRARAGVFSSPVNDSYADYIGKALETDLAAAGKLDRASTRTVTGVLERNSLSGDAITTNTAAITVRFRVADGQATRYDKAVSVDEEWESAFLGAVAIPRAIQNYVASVQKLIGKLFADPDFVAATAR